MSGENGRMDNVGGGGGGRGLAVLLYSFLLFLHFVQGSISRAPMRRWISLRSQEGAARPLSAFPMSCVLHVVHIPPRGEGCKTRNKSVGSLLGRRRRG